MSARSITKACHRLTLNHQANSGTSVNTSPPSKPMACAMRRLTLRPRTAWRDSQRSKAQLNPMFHSTAITEAATEATLACDAFCPVSAANPKVATTMAMSSYSVTYTTRRRMPCRLETGLEVAMGRTLCALG